jgi:predicted cytidylate kinase
MQRTFDNITISGKIGVGTSTLARALRDTLGWKYINAGEIQRRFDAENNLETNKNSALSRSDDHEKEIDDMTRRILTTENHLIYEAWLSGFVAKDLPNVLRVLLICSDEAIRIDRVVNRDKMSVEEAKKYIQVREEGNIAKWKSLYGDYDFWSPEYFDIVIDTYSKGPDETVQIVLETLGKK